MLFFRNHRSNEEISWDQLILDLNSNSLEGSHSYALIKTIIGNNLNGNDLMLKPDLRKDEMVLDIPVQIEGKKHLVHLLRNNRTNWTLGLNSSGTTGQPKSISHGYDVFMRNIKWEHTGQDKVWGLCYTLSHIAGLKVLFQALMTESAIVNLHGLTNKEIEQEIDQCQVTHLSATPTFYRMMLPINSVYPKLEAMTSGGECFDSATMLNLKSHFPSAQTLNVYASTELGTLLASRTEVFELDGKRSQHFKVENGELLARSSSDSSWTYTGDRVDIVALEPLRFKIIGRSDQVVNIGGLLINLQEIERQLLSIDEIFLARVYAKRNSVMGQVLCAEVVTLGQIEEKTIRAELGKKVREEMIPRFIEFKDALSLTSSGKIARI